jgi:rubrerythrin
MNRPSPENDRPAGSPIRRRALLLGGAALGATIAAPALTTTAAALPEEDIRALRLLSLVEHAQVAFYAEALRRGNLEGELTEYARQVESQEREHLGALQELLGQEAPRKPSFEFGSATQASDAFAATAAEIEDLAVAAYNGLGASVSPDVLAAAATIVSVEARHAAWIRSIAGRLPAADATDKALSAEEVRAGLVELGMKG